jgi:hypothetical protein
VTVEVPVRLVRREVTFPDADAFLLFVADPAPLARACAGLGAAWPQVYPVRGGFLLVLPAPTARSVPGAVRLRRLLGDLFVPTDADLLPALLSEEAVALTRDRGLVVLPGGTILAFDASSPLSVVHWLAPAQVQRPVWEPFPPRPGRADALTTIERPAPPVAAVLDVLGPGGPDDAKPLPGPGEGAGRGVPEDARPPAGSFLGRTAGSAGMATAGFLAWLGRQLGSGGLARLGGALARRALEAVPRLSEQLLGAQEAALRDVLRELQTGDVEKGLRHAPPAVSDPNQPAHIGTGTRLTARDPRYSLRALVGAGGGPVSVWLGGGDVWAELAREYRRLASEATARGDHRRAAYLYGVLLRDLRAAANVLLAGGLYRDAALLLRDRLNDPRAAAEAFDRAGDHDEALRLYDLYGEFEKAGDLLRRLGEDERAVNYYCRAADLLAAEGRYLAAGDLMRMKALRRDLATRFYRRGWQSRGAENVSCAEQLLDEYLVAENWIAVEELWSEAELTLVDRPRDTARFFNYALRVSEDLLPVETRADLSDRARLLFAAHMRAHATINEAGALVGEFFPPGRPWAPPVVRDATFVTRKRRAEPPPREVREWSVVRIAGGAVTAVTVVRGTFDLLVAAAEGIVCWRVAEGRVVPVGDRGERVTALAASIRGEMVYAVARGADDNWRLRAFTADRTGAYLATTQYTLPTDESDEPEFYLQPTAAFHAGEHRATVVTPVEAFTFVGPYLQHAPADGVIDAVLDAGRPVRLLAEAGDGYSWIWAGTVLRCRSPGDEPTHHNWHITWVPASNVDWITPAPGVLDIVAVDGGGDVCWIQFDARDPSRPTGSSAFACQPLGYSVACLIAPGVVGAVTSGNEVHWLRVVGNKLTVTASTRIGVPGRVVALAARPQANELAAVLADGYAIRLQRP